MPRKTPDRSGDRNPKGLASMRPRPDAAENTRETVHRVLRQVELQ